MSFSFSIGAEPRLPLLGVGQAKVIVAQDDRNHLLNPPEGPPDGGRYYNGGYKSYTQQSQLNLVPGSREARKVRLLRGLVPLTLLIEQKSEVVAEKVLTVKGKKFKVADASLDLHEVKDLGGGTYHAKLSIDKTGENDPNDYTWRNSLYQRVVLEDAKGNKYFSQGYIEANFTQTGVNGTFLFSTNGNAALGARPG